MNLGQDINQPKSVLPDITQPQFYRDNSNPAQITDIIIPGFQVKQILILIRANTPSPMDNFTICNISRVSGDHRLLRLSR
jgi:hypothetical protein